VAALLGVTLASLLALVPALHVVTVAGLMLAIADALQPSLPAELWVFLLLGLTVGYGTLNALPSIFLAAPDDSTVFVVLPGERYVLERRGHEAVVLTGIGSLGSIVVLALLAPLASAWVPDVHAVLQPHLHWIMWALIAWLLLSEWPKGGEHGPSGWLRLGRAWRNLAAGLATFLLSGALGLILSYRSPLSVNAAQQGLMPAFTGLFAVPWLLQSLIARIDIPRQHLAPSVDVQAGMVLRGVLTGVFGGLFAAFFPVVTGGIGALMAGHATAQRDDRLFLLSQGAQKAVYYVGSLLLFFIPGMHLTRGGVAWLISSRWESIGPGSFALTVALILISGALSFLLLFPLSRLLAGLVGRLPRRWLTLTTLALLIAGVAAVAGWPGLLVCAVATGIGLIPLLWGARRANCMGVLLLPLALDLVGLGSRIVAWLGLV